MASLKSILDQIGKLPPEEQRSLFEHVLPRWYLWNWGYEPGIERTQGVCGGSACIVRTRIPVWLLHGLHQQGMSEADILYNYPTLRAEDLVNAWAYARTHREEIERELQENEAA